MKHRHLVDDPGFAAAAIDDVLDRGSQRDWAELLAAIEADPWGPVANSVLEICAQHEMYGTSKLWPRMISFIRDGGGA